MKLRVLIPRNRKAGLIREYDDNFYEKIRVYKSRCVTDIDSAADFALRIRSLSALRIDHFYFEDLQLRDEENSLPVEEDGDIPDGLLISYIHADNIDLIKFIGEYHGKSIEIGIRKNEWEVWLRILHLMDDELKMLENELGLY